MTKLITIFIISLISTICYSQDSVRLKVTKIGTMEDKTIYWLKDVDTKERYVTICKCSKRKKGEVVKVAKKDLIIIKDSFTKKDLE